MAIFSGKIVSSLLAAFVAIRASPITYPEPSLEQDDAFHYNLHDAPRSTQHHVLKPRYPPEHDASDHLHLIPEETKSLFWGQDSPNGRPFVGGRFASSLTTFKYPTVVLDHSMHVSTVLRGQVLTVKFPDYDIYEKTTISWTDLPMLLVTSEGSDQGHLQYLLASSIDCQDLSTTCLLNVTAADFEKVADEFTLQWGHYEDLRTRSMAAWDPDQFDHHKDAQYGYYTFEDGDRSDLAVFAEGLTDYDPAHHIDHNADYAGIFGQDGSHIGLLLEVHDEDFFEEHVPGTKLAKRLKIPNPIQKLANKVDALAQKGAGIAKDAGNAIAQKAQQGAQKFKEAIDKVKDKVIDPVVKVIKYVSGTPAPLNLDWEKTIPEPKDENSNPQQTFKKENGTPYKAKEIYKSSKNSKIEKKLYCLECGVKVTAKLAGEIVYKIGSGLERGTLKVDAGFVAQLILGFEAGIEVEKDLMNKRVAEVPIPGLGVPGVISIGPMLTLDAKATLKAGITGNVMVGGSLEMNLKHEFDLKNTNKRNKPTITGPKFKSHFNAEAEISAGLTISTPIGLVVGLSVGNEKILGVTAGLYSEPAIEASASIGISADKNGVKAANDCKGVKVAFEIQHTLYAQVSAKILKKEMIKEGKYEIHKAQKELPGSQCFAIKAMKKLGTREAANETLFDLSAFNAAQTFIDVNDPVTPETLVSTGFEAEEFKLPAAIAEFTSDQGPPDYFSDPNVNPIDQSATVFNYTFISDEHLEWDLVATDSGNLGVQHASEFSNGNAIFETYESIVMGDAFGRILVYFSDEMEKFKVSRARLENAWEVPQTSKIFGLVPIRDDSLKIPSEAPKALLVASDTVGRIFFTVLCTYKNAQVASKIFLVEDVDAGIATLKDPKTDSTLTGEAIDACTYWPMINGLDSII